MQIKCGYRFVDMRDLHTLFIKRRLATAERLRASSHNIARVVARNKLISFAVPGSRSRNFLMKAPWFSGAEHHRKVSVRSTRDNFVHTYRSLLFTSLLATAFQYLRASNFAESSAMKTTPIKCRTLVCDRRTYARTSCVAILQKLRATERATCALSIIKTDDNNARIIGLSLEQDVHCYLSFLFLIETSTVRGPHSFILHFFFNAKVNSTAHLTTCVCEKRREKKEHFIPSSASRI